MIRIKGQPVAFTYFAIYGMFIICSLIGALHVYLVIRHQAQFFTTDMTFTMVLWNVSLITIVLIEWRERKNS